MKTLIATFALAFLCLPAGVGASELDDIPPEVARVSDSLKRAYAPDSRVALFDVDYTFSGKDVMLRGVTIEDSATTFIGPDVTIGADTIIRPGCYIMGKTVIGEGNLIGPNTYIEDSVILPGGSTDNPSGDNLLWVKWEDVVFGEVDLKQGDNVFTFTVISTLTHASGDNGPGGSCAANIDRLEVKFVD